MSETPEWLDDKGKIIEHKYCRCFLEKQPMLSKGEDFFTTEGIVTDKDRLLRDVFDDIKEHLTGGLVTKAKNLLEAIRMECYDRGELEKYQDRIFLANGTLFLDGRFVEEKGFCLNRLPIAYNPNAPQPEVWLRFLSELLEPEDILTLQEFMGYCLIPCTRGQVMLLIKGNGGEGKSRIGVVMHTLFGANAKNGSIDKVENSAFARADLQHVLVMVDDDTKMEALSSTHYVKSIITAETPMDLERKKEQSFQGDMYVRFMAFSNGDLEALYDKSEGFFRRQLILQTRRKPPGRVDDPYLSDKLKQEAEGIFLWCLEGLRRLQSNNYRFTVSQRVAENIPPRVFKEMTRLTKQKAKLEELLADVNAFNAKGKASEIGVLLDKYIPAVEQMHTTLKKYSAAFTTTTAENKKLKKENEQLEQSLNEATQGSTLKKLADAKLHRDYEDALALLDRIPKEVLAEYAHRPQPQKNEKKHNR